MMMAEWLIDWGTRKRNLLGRRSAVHCLQKVSHDIRHVIPNIVHQIWWFPIPLSIAPTELGSKSNLQRDWFHLETMDVSLVLIRRSCNMDQLLKWWNSISRSIYLSAEAWSPGPIHLYRIFFVPYDKTINTLSTSVEAITQLSKCGPLFVSGGFQIKRLHMIHLSCLLLQDDFEKSDWSYMGKWWQS